MRASGIMLGGAIALAAAAALMSCGKAPQGRSETPAAATADKDTNSLALATNSSVSALPKDVNRLPLKELMGHVMQYGGDGIWKRQGWVTDINGEHSLFPKTAQQWEEAESASLTLAELTNILLLPGRRVDDANWDKAVAGVRAVALQAAAAAEKHDETAFFSAGAELDTACENCHRQFAPWAITPGKKTADPKKTG